MATDPQLTIIMPAYGEAENLKHLLPKIKAVLEKEGILAQILVVDTATPLDNTAQVCNQVGATYLPRQGGNRYGDALRTGIKASTGKYVITLDSDGSHNPEFIGRLWEHRDDADVVIASRYIPGGATENPWILVTMSRILNIVFKIMVGMPVYDISNSYRLYRGDMLRSINPEFSNFDILEEILARLLWKNPDHPARVIEIPFRFEQRLQGKPKRKLVVFTIQFITALFKLRALRKSSGFSK